MRNTLCTVKVYLSDENIDEYDCLDFPSINEAWLSLQTSKRWIHYNVVSIIKYETF